MAYTLDEVENATRWQLQERGGGSGEFWRGRIFGMKNLADAALRENGFRDGGKPVPPPFIYQHQDHLKAEEIRKAKALKLSGGESAERDNGSMNGGLEDYDVEADIFNIENDDE